MNGSGSATALSPATGVVATAHPEATKAGVAALAAGGNAIDAAVAAAWALSVCEPSGSGLGGQTVLALRLTSGRVVVLDAHSRAPAAVSKQTVSRAQQRTGYRATTVPTTPMALGCAQRRFGRLSLRQALEPAIALAEDGYAITPLQSRQLSWCRDQLLATPSASDFLCQGRPYLRGERFRQSRLAACLQRIAEHGVEDFYSGEIAQSIDRDMQRHGGLLRASDLRNVSAPEEREPLRGRFRNRLVLTTPAPSGGPQLLYALGALEAMDGQASLDDPDAWYERVALAVHAAFSARERSHREPGGPPRPEALALSGVDSETGGETTHVCAADGHGNVVSLTQSIQSLFGAKVANPDYGFLYNNYLTTCPRRRSHAFRLSAGGPARSNAAPTLVDSSGVGPGLALGAAGSRRIISSIVQVTSAIVDDELSLDDAVALARVHPRLSGRVWVERPAATPRLTALLRARFREVTVRGRHSYAMGAVQALQYGSGPHRLRAAADPRRDGAASGT